LSGENELWELKETAKWSDNIKEKKMAINELSLYEEDAIQYLDEIRNITIYDEIKEACREAIETITEKKKKHIKTDQQPSQPPKEHKTATDIEFDPTATKLADLPP
jgi:hypothetical protein